MNSEKTEPVPEKLKPCSDHRCYHGDAKWCEACSEELRDTCRKADRNPK